MELQDATAHIQDPRIYAQAIGDEQLPMQADCIGIEHRKPGQATILRVKLLGSTIYQCQCTPAGYFSFHQV